MNGSSPLARGLLLAIAIISVSRRIIPARAGFTRYVRASSQTREDHPRSRGVYPSQLPLLQAHFGSSPLARGLPLTKMASLEPRRIIPARAGFTGASCDHPGCDAGSSPLARGLLCPRIVCIPRPRIIPARAGFTVAVVVVIGVSPDHPRSRGVYAAAASWIAAASGSSPLARGLRELIPGTEAMAGIIPARAGFTAWSASPWVAPRDHPRSRGVYMCAPFRGRRPRGSSPLARGLLVGFVLARGRGRIIPARAGFTQMRQVAFTS